MSQAGPLAVGSLGVLALAAFLFSQSPSPGDLARAHAGLAGAEKLAGCDLCHAPEGLDAGCLGCHDEIAEQLEHDRGYHAHAIGDAPADCARCHPEHHGRDFDVMEALAWTGSREEFGHGHVAFRLSDAHEDLACDACHTAGDRRTYLGLDQACASCHDDVHGSERFRACDDCHDQTAFDPASRFDHAEHLPLTRGHDDLACGACHRLETAGHAFHEVRGTTCAACHESPHSTEWDESCEACHAPDAAPWTEATLRREDHARTGFALAAPHSTVACADCHRGAPYEARFPRPPRAPDDCARCHSDIHEGQFGNRTCLACHERLRFRPSLVTRDGHVRFPLAGAHRRAACDACHRADAETDATRYIGLAKRCANCHESPHRGQFEGARCDACHDEERFVPAHYDRKAHEKFALTGAHQAVACRACHVEDRTLRARRFEGTPRQCRDCHEDPHGAQFTRESRRGDCTSCHEADASTFRLRPFDHAARTEYALTGAHADAECARCHVRAEETGVRLYRGTPRQCASCHDDVHRGQFRVGGLVDCSRCHVAGRSFRELDFDHKDTRFPLDETHAAVACARCHPSVRQPDGSRVVQYRPLGTQCGDCHEVER